MKRRLGRRWIVLLCFLCVSATLAAVVNHFVLDHGPPFDQEDRAHPDPLKSPTSPDDLFAGTQAGESWDSNPLKMKFCWCPAGKFKIAKEVTLTHGFWMGKTEVTQAQWKAVMNTEPWKGKSSVKEGADYPATFVNWNVASEFCAKLTKHRAPPGWEYRLPTEAQWAYACRAGSPSAYSFGNDDAQLGDYAWFEDNTHVLGESYAHRVRIKKASGWGLHDMHGNVWEWCRDWYHPQLPEGTDPEATQVASHRVSRGGSWFFPAGHCRWAFRYMHAPDARGGSLGFRVAAVQVSE